VSGPAGTKELLADLLQRVEEAAHAEGISRSA
jgi:hypothetical protein